MLQTALPGDPAIFGDLQLPWNKPIELIPFFVDITASESIIRNDIDDGSFKTAATFESASAPSPMNRISPTAACSPVSHFHPTRDHSSSKLPSFMPFPDVESSARQNSVLESTQLVSFKTKPKLHITPASPSNSISAHTPSPKDAKDRPRSRPHSGQLSLSARIGESLVNCAMMITASARHSLGRGAKSKVGVDCDSTDSADPVGAAGTTDADETLRNSGSISLSQSQHQHPADHALHHNDAALGLSPEQDESDLFLITTGPSGHSVHSGLPPMTRVNSTLSATSGTSSVSHKSHSEYAFSPSRTLALSINGDSTTPPSRRRYVGAPSTTTQVISSDSAKKILSELAQQTRVNSGYVSPNNSDKSIHNNKHIVGLMG